MTKPVIAQYLKQYAEPEAAGYELGEWRCSCALVIPVFRESPAFLDRMRLALRSASGPVLVVVVVNASASSARFEAEHATLLTALTSTARRLDSRGAAAAPAWLDERAERRLLVIDRAHEPWLVPRARGVGLARKIGFDVATACYARGQLASPWIYSADADATLPAGHFDSAPNHGGAMVFPFAHAPSDDAPLNAATWAYECALRYHVLGLRAAGSPYAWHALGSALAVNVEAYVRVRGFPKRAAAEDFYLLQKVAKWAPVHCVRAPEVTIASRRSDRVPMGTGPAVAALLRGDPSLVEAPEAYRALRAVHEAVQAPGSSLERAALARVPELQQPLRQLQVNEAWQRAAGSTRTLAAATRRFLAWFDGLKTRQLLRALRAVYPPLPLREAVASADFLPESVRAIPERLTLGPASAEDWAHLRTQLASLEAEAIGR